MSELGSLHTTGSDLHSSDRLSFHNRLQFCVKIIKARFLKDSACLEVWAYLGQIVSWADAGVPVYSLDVDVTFTGTPPDIS